LWKVSELLTEKQLLHPAPAKFDKGKSNPVSLSHLKRVLWPRGHLSRGGLPHHCRPPRTLWG